MKIPLEWLSEFVKLPEDVSILTDKLTMAGHMLDKIEGTGKNVVVDLELRGNRADCYSIFGIAREVSAIFNTPLKYPLTDKSHKSKNTSGNFNVNVESKYVKRVMAVKVNNIKITRSPGWLKERLEKYGIQSLNNIVDLTNYIMIETGEPMHAFDADKVGKDLYIRLAKKGQKMRTFQDKEINLTNDDLVWSNGQNVLSVAGAIGSKEFSISETTKNIILEAASYEPGNIRRTIYRHNLLTDAGIRHEKKLDPEMVEEGINRYIYLLVKEGWGEVEDSIYDFYPDPIKPNKIQLDFKFLNAISGSQINKKQVFEIFESLNFNVNKRTDNYAIVSPPTFRTDVESREDLVEEILRIIGYDTIPANTLALEIPDDITPQFITQEKDIKSALFSLGFDEIINIPFVQPKYLNLNMSLTDRSNPVTISNRPSPEIEEMRMNMFPGLLANTQKIIDEHGEYSLISEVGKIYFQKANKYFEKRAVGLLYWQKENSSYRVFKGFLDALIIKSFINNVEFTPFENPIFAKFFQMSVNKKTIGVGGKYGNIYFAEIYLDNILDNIEKPQIKRRLKHPPQIEDLTVKIPNGVGVGKVIVAIKNSDKTISEVELKDVYNNSYTFRISYQDPEKTLNNKDVEKIRTIIISTLKEKYNIII